MRSTLELRTPSNGTGWSERWSFSGADDRLLRECLQQFTEYAIDPPTETWDHHATRHVIANGDRWHVAMLLWPDDRSERHAVAEILPERLDNLRAAIRARFSASSVRP